MTEDDRYDFDLGESIEVPPNHTVRYLLIVVALLALMALAAGPVQMAHHDAVIREATRIAGQSAYSRVAYVMPEPLYNCISTGEFFEGSTVNCDAGHSFYCHSSPDDMTTTGSTYVPTIIETK